MKAVTADQRALAERSLAEPVVVGVVVPVSRLDVPLRGVIQDNPGEPVLTDHSGRVLNEVVGRPSAGDHEDDDVHDRSE